MNSSTDTIDSTVDDHAFKASMRAQWDRAAAGWNAHTAEIRAWLHKPTDAMCRMAGVGVGSRVLDVAAGSGDQTLAVARLVGPQGTVLATDLSPAIVALAQDNARRAGFGHVEARVADGEDLGVAEASFDAAICRLGLMFLPDPLRGLREIPTVHCGPAVACARWCSPGGFVCLYVAGRPIPARRRAPKLPDGGPGFFAFRVYEAVVRGLRRSATSRHPIGRKLASRTTGLKVQLQ